jgi:glycosyltransferase involved in cell wall biosynthesis
VPLTWGAGVKGKVTQSLAQGLPVVTTPVGAEGLNLEHGVNVLVGATSSELCAETARLLVDDDLWSSMSEHGLALARLEYSPQRLEREIATLLATVARHG